MTQITASQITAKQVAGAQVAGVQPGDSAGGLSDNLWTDPPDIVPAGWVDLGGGSYQRNVAAQSDMEVTGVIEDGGRYLVQLNCLRVAPTFTISIGGANRTIANAADQEWVVTSGGSNNSIRIRGSATANGFISGVVVRKFL